MLVQVENTANSQTASFLTQRRSRASQTLAKKIANFWRENKKTKAISYGESRVKESAYFPTTLHKDTIVKISSILQRPEIPEWIRSRLENHFSPTGNNKKTIFLDRKPEKNEKILKIFWWRSPVSRIVPKTPRSPFDSQNVSFLVKIEVGVLQWKQTRKKSQKTPVLNKIK